MNLKVFLLGASEISNKLSQKKLREKFPELIIDGYSPPYSSYPFPKELSGLILEKINVFLPDILFVAFGAPKQEFWIDDNRTSLEKIGVRLAMGVGGTFDMVAGIEERAPILIQKMGFEGIWRLCQNPKRLKRFVKLFRFFRYMLK